MSLSVSCAVDLLGYGGRIKGQLRDPKDCESGLIDKIYGVENAANSVSGVFVKARLQQ